MLFSVWALWAPVCPNIRSKVEIYVILSVCSVEANDDDDDEIMNVLFSF